MPTPIKAARGVRDILPAERAAFAVVEHAAREEARRYGYQEVEVPVIEPVELIERGVGGDTDVARKELYRLEPHGDGESAAAAGARLVLRPEGAASMVGAYLQGGLHKGPHVVGLFSMSPLF